MVSLEVEMLDRANSGPEPTVEILRAIRHGVAAGACRAAGRATGDANWTRKAVEQSRASRTNLHQAIRSRVADLAKADCVGACPSISESRASARDRRRMPISLSPDDN